MNPGFLRRWLGLVLAGGLGWGAWASPIGHESPGAGSGLPIVGMDLDGHCSGSIDANPKLGNSLPQRSFGQFTFDFYVADEARFPLEESNVFLPPPHRGGVSVLSSSWLESAFSWEDEEPRQPSPVSDPGGILQLLSLGLAAMAGIGWVRCRGETLHH